MEMWEMRRGNVLISLQELGMLLNIGSDLPNYLTIFSSINRSFKSNRKGGAIMACFLALLFFW